MKLPSSFINRRTAVDLQLTPMIDCVFLLMVYFIWASSFQIAEKNLPAGISAELSQGGGAESDIPPAEADFDKVVVRIIQTPQGSPTFLLNDAAIGDQKSLQGKLARIVKIQRFVPVVIHPDPEIGLGTAIDTFDLVRLIGFDKVMLAANK
ncbi:MAG: ExbD/TolR family protein [Planctomycetaceae bacterium]